MAISVSAVLLGHPYIHQTSRAKQPNSTNQTCTDRRFDDPQPFSYATVINTETMHAEEVEVIAEQPTMSIEPTVHLSNQRRSPVTLCAVQRQNEIPQICSLVASAESMSPPNIPIVSTSFKRIYRTQRPKNSHQASEIAASSSNLGERQLRPRGSAYLGLHQFTPPCHAFMPNQYIYTRKIKPGGWAGHNRCDPVPDVLSLSELGWVTTTCCFL